jgi:hypothetical protein
MGAKPLEKARGMLRVRNAIPLPYPPQYLWHLPWGIDYPWWTLFLPAASWACLHARQGSLFLGEQSFVYISPWVWINQAQDSGHGKRMVISKNQVS